MTVPKPLADSTSVPPDIGPDEKLGRAIYSGTGFQKRGVRFHHFYEKGHTRLSVDRLSIAPFDEAVKIAELRGQYRANPQEFYGWAVVEKTEVIEEGLSVEASPVTHPPPPNPYHADIVLPEDPVDSDAKHRAHAQNLAKRSKW